MSVAMKILALPFLIVGYFFLILVCGSIGLYQLIFGPSHRGMSFDPKKSFMAR